MTPGAVGGVPRWILRVEGLAVLGVSLLLYRQFGGGWGLLVLCFLLPDLSILGYLAGPRAGATLYNLAHSYIGPILLWLATRSISSSWAVFAVLIWTAHLGFDRAAGYGLKYSSSFANTHLGTLGRARGLAAGIAD
jgi:hypothetical protein